MTTQPRRAPHLRLVEDKPRPHGHEDVLTYTNRHGEPYFLHQGRTKTGKARYFVARTIGEGAIGTLPAGFELAESINGVVSVCRADPTRPQAPRADIETVRAEIAHHQHLRRYVVDERGGEILIHEPEGGVDEEGLRAMAAALFVSPERMRAASIRRRPRYTPVMRFSPEPLGAGIYAVYRMTYRGHGGWHLLSAGPVAAVAKRYVGHIGRESFYELI